MLEVLVEVDVLEEVSRGRAPLERVNLLLLEEVVAAGARACAAASLPFFVLVGRLPSACRQVRCVSFLPGFWVVWLMLPECPAGRGRRGGGGGLRDVAEVDVVVVCCWEGCLAQCGSGIWC